MCTRSYSWLTILILILPAPAQAPPDQLLLQGGTHLVLVNVVVKDKHGKPVGDLTRDDFVLRDNGQEKKITGFSLEQVPENAPAAVTSATPLTFTNRPGPDAAAVTVFLFDELNTKVGDQQLAKKDFIHYLRGFPPSSRVAVFVLGDSLVLLHDFSQDMASLVAALTRHGGRVNPEVDAATAAPAVLELAHGRSIDHSAVG